MPKVDPFEVRKAERIRYEGREYTWDAIPDEFRDVAYGHMEYLVGGVWRRAHGSWRCGDEPCVWLETLLPLTVYYAEAGGHVHCRVFCNGKAGDLVFAVAEWPEIQTRLSLIASVVPEP